MLKKAIALSAMVIALWAPTSQAGLNFASTRVVFSENNREGVIRFRNPDNIPYLVQAWVSLPDSEKAEPPLFATPPLAILGPLQGNTIRIIKTSKALPEDRESLYWLNVKAIPSVKPKGNEIVLAVNTVMKVIYRPSSIKSTLKEAAPKLQ